jgi:anti-anti-sigma factor
MTARQVFFGLAGFSVGPTGTPLRVGVARTGTLKTGGENMNIVTSGVGEGVAVVEIEGEVDAHTARQLESALNDLLAQGCTRLVLDASQMGFISSAGLRALVFAHREACQGGGQVRVFGLSPQARRIFEMAGLDECLEMCDTRQEAMAGW